MRIAPISYTSQVLISSHNQNLRTKPLITAENPSFGAFGFDDASFLDEPSNGYSILDLIKWLRKDKPYKPTADDVDRVLETWDPDLGDIRDITNPQNNNFGPLEDAIRDFESGKLNRELEAKEKARQDAERNAIPSIFVNMKDEEEEE